MSARAPDIDRPPVDFALYLASHGFRVLPIPPREKGPVLKDWPTKPPAAQALGGSRRCPRRALEAPLPTGAWQRNRVGREARCQARQRDACSGGPAEREGHRSCNGLEEGGIGDAENRHDERAVEVVVAHLARGLGDQRAAVTGGAMQPAFLHALAGRVLGTRSSLRGSAPHETAAAAPSTRQSSGPSWW